MDGPDATRRITEDAPPTGVKVVVLTACELDECVVEAIRAGASGFLVKVTEPRNRYARYARWSTATRCCRPV
jgi:DNA-binding NarL/FixJ family response regulator